MKRSFLAALIVFLLAFAGHELVKNDSHSEMGYFFLILWGTLIFFPSGLTLLILAYTRNKYWNNVFFLTSAFANTLMGLLCFSTGQITTIALYTLPFLTGIAMLVLFYKKHFRK